MFPQILHNKLQSRVSLPCIRFRRVSHFDAISRVKGSPFHAFDAVPPDGLELLSFLILKLKLQMLFFHDKRFIRKVKALCNKYRFRISGAEGLQTLELLCNTKIKCFRRNMSVDQQG